mgnify:CR=1 FL=1
MPTIHINKSSHEIIKKEQLKAIIKEKRNVSQSEIVAKIIKNYVNFPTRGKK